MHNKKLGQNKNRRDSAIGILVERNILKMAINSLTRKPTTNFLINPKLNTGGNL